MDEARLSRLRYRAWRRGFSEADLILGPFVDRRARDLTPAQFDALEDLLDQPDHDLYGWIVGLEAPPAAFDGEVLGMLRDFRPAARGPQV